MVNTYTGIHKGAYTIAHKGTCTVNVTHKGIHIIRHQGAYYVLLCLTVYVVMLIQYRVNYAKLLQVLPQQKVYNKHSIIL